MENNNFLKPMKKPLYSVPDGYTTDDLRAMAVKAMGDIISVQWRADKVYEYHNRFDIPNKNFHYEPGITYAGMPYANAHTGIFQWYAYYDEQTGLMSFPGDGQTWGETLGTVCANCILWAWAPFCNSFKSKCYSFLMSPQNGFETVGNLPIPDEVDNFRDFGNTDGICNQAGVQAVYEAYAQTLPADALISGPRVHAVMVIEKPTVVRNPDGSINGEESYFIIRDQRGGVNEKNYILQEDGRELYYTGRMAAKISFYQMEQWKYIPVTVKELVGKKKVDAEKMYFDRTPTTVLGMLRGHIHSNYITTVVEAKLQRADGTEEPVAVATYVFEDGGWDNLCSEGRVYDLKKLKAAGLEQKLASMERQPGDTLILYGTLASGTVRELVRLRLKEER